MKYDWPPYKMGEFGHRHRERALSLLELCCHKPRKFQKLGDRPGTAPC